MKRQNLFSIAIHASADPTDASGALFYNITVVDTYHLDDQGLPRPIGESGELDNIQDAIIWIDDAVTAFQETGP